MTTKRGTSAASTDHPSTTQPASPTGGEKQIELTPIHDFAAKLKQPEILPRLKAPAAIFWRSAQVHSALSAQVPWLGPSSTA